MKHLFLLCLSVLLLASCSSGRYPSALYVADSLSVACPERAVALLDSLRPQMEQEGERVRMYYQLLCVKARDKAYLPHTSDSLVLEVLRYYEDKQDLCHLPEAYYYAGRVASDLGDAPQALDYFQQALDAMPEGEMTDLRSRTISQMG
ncbi:amino acid ABC transporter permease, partial [Mediterranea sp. An20]